MFKLSKPKKDENLNAQQTLIRDSEKYCKGTLKQEPQRMWSEKISKFFSDIRIIGVDKKKKCPK